jgi:ribosomal protein S18 acetylase RimI-like enzyme
MPIRRAELADATGIAQVHVAAWRSAYRGLLPDDLLERLSIADSARRWQGRIAQPWGHIFVAEREGIVGFAACGETRDEDVDREKVGELYVIYVHPAEWRQGLGRALLQEALRCLQEEGFERVLLWVLQGNEQAIRFYERAGFEADGASRIKRRSDGTEMPIVRYLRQIAMVAYVVMETVEKGYGVFATRDIKENEHICHVDLRGLPSYTLDELERQVAAHPELTGDHANYVGHGKYVIEDSPASYMNHSCAPNCYFQMKSIAVYDVFAFRDIAAGEELTHDYTANSVDQFAGQGFWVLECQCGSENCRRRVTGDYFEMPQEWQRKFYRHLPSSIKRKYRDRFQELFRK